MAAYFSESLIHKLGTNEFARNARGGEGIAVFLLPVQFGQNGSLGPGIGFTLPGSVDGNAIAQDGAGFGFPSVGILRSGASSGSPPGMVMPLGEGATSASSADRWDEIRRAPRRMEIFSSWLSVGRKKSRVVERLS